MSDFKPKIIAFCCYYCAYAAADVAGSLRLQYAPEVRLIEMPCSGRVDPVILLKAFEEGADGVYVAGCLEGDCHFLKGNLRAKKRVQYVQEKLAELGIEPERLAMYNLSGAQGNVFARVADEFTQRIKQLGPSPIRGCGR
ncbi:hydrogenase iron-sulfur subunit [Desulfofalx alkaliphila]|uniref:hydrogenase iron-sulfur subunit n=1 Tax=Desulfofalx alkaliphila TaxID=105483 RepID=UPI0004E0F979|nr:hydrogenase iron-sulfur subunit [Desulfofalx alkaliphila]